MTTPILRTLEVTLENDGSVRAARGQYIRVNGSGADESIGTKIEPDAMAVLPAQIRSAAEFGALTDERDAALAQVNALQSEKSELEETVATLQSEKDAAQGNVTALEAVVSARDAEIAELTAQIEELTPPAQGPAIHVAWFRAALADLGLLTAVDNAVAQQPVVKQELWEYATSIDITRPDVVAIAEALEIDLAAVLARAREIRDADA